MTPSKNGGGPTSFLGGPAYHPPATKPERPEEPRTAYVPRAVASLTVQADGLIYLNAEASRQLPKGDNTIDLRAPIRAGRGDHWHLDCRPGGLYTRQAVGASGCLRFRAKDRAVAMLGCLPGPVTFELEHVGNGLFRLFTKDV